MKCCKECKWWAWREVMNTLEEEKIGVCHKRPPTPEPTNSIGMFPRTIEGCWCGEFEPKETKCPNGRISEAAQSAWPIEASDEPKEAT